MSSAVPGSGASALPRSTVVVATYNERDNIRRLLPSPVTDCTSGYHAYRSTVLRSIDFENAVSDGYGFLVELLEMVRFSRFRIGEVPILYEDRHLGRSNTDRWVVIESVWRRWLLLARRAGAFLRRHR